MSIYFMTFLFSLFLWMKHKEDIGISVSVKELSLKKMLYLVTLTICGIPVAVILNALGSVMSGSGSESINEACLFPVIPALIIYALIPAVVEEFVFRGVILGLYSKVDVRAGILISSLFFALLHFNPGSVLYGFLFGVIFALVKLSTENILYTMIMHFIFNGVNVLLSYVNLESVPTVAVVIFIVAITTIFIILLFGLVKDFVQTSVNLPSMTNGKKYAMHRLITKEGYVTLAVCLTVMGMLLMM